MSLHTYKRRALTVLLATVLVHGCDRRKAAPPIPTVGVMVVQSKQVPLTTELPGRTSSYRVAEIRPQVSGIVQKRLFAEGTDVKAGELLYEIDPAPFKAALDVAEASLNVAKSTAQRAHAAVKARQAGIERQKAALDLALANKKHFEDLLKDGLVCESDLNQAVAIAEVAQAALQVARTPVENDVQAQAVAGTTIDLAQAAVETARVNLSYTKITAPISGRIGRSVVAVGAMVTAYQPESLATIQQLDPIYVDIPQSTGELLRLKQRLEDSRSEHDGDSQNGIIVTLVNGETYPWKGTLQVPGATVEPSTASVILRALLPNPDGVLLPGMSVRATIQEGVKRSAILIPQEAVSRNFQGEPTAMVVGSDERAVLRVLAVDRVIGNKWLVSSGLVAGDRLIVDGVLEVRPGNPVKAVPVDTAPAQAPLAAIGVGR